MSDVNELLDAFCPQCANEQVYVEKRHALPDDEGDAYQCRCGKCGWRFRVMEPEPLIADAPPIA